MRATGPRTDQENRRWHLRPRIIRTSDAPFRLYLDGIGDPSRPVGVLCQCEPGAIVSDAPEELRPKRRELLAHQHGLDQAAAGGGPRPRALPRVRRGRVRRRGVAGRRGGASAMRVPPPSRPRSERRRTSRRRGVVTRKTEGARAGTGAGLGGDVLTQEDARRVPGDSTAVPFHRPVVVTFRTGGVLPPTPSGGHRTAWLEVQECEEGGARRAPGRRGN